VGETKAIIAPLQWRKFTFSILERIDVGETSTAGRGPPPVTPPFSILERIDVGETT